MYFHHPQQGQQSPSPSLPNHKLQQQQHDGWGRHPGVFAGPSGSGMAPYGQYPPPQHHHPHHPQHHHPQQSFSSQHHPSPSPMHQQVGGLLIGNLGNNTGNGSHSSPPIQHAGAEDTVHWQQQIVKYTACRQASAPHYRARAAAIAGRMSNNNKSAISIQDPNRPSSTKPNGFHKKDNSISGQTSDSDDGTGVSLGRPGSALSHPSALASPVVVSSDASNQQPWSGLDLGGIHLKTLSPSLFAFSHVTSLYINHNSLTSLPAAISLLRKLTVLDATGNQLRAIPPELGMITTLKELLLFDNQISDLPPELGTLYQLDVLGIAGNPLPESLRLILEKDGTQALIAYLRDSCPVPLPPPDREWATVEADNGLSPETAPESFTILCYNILCEWYAPGATYPYTPGWALAWDYRKELILQEVMGCGADFICLQEVDEEQYNDTFLANLSKEGYEGAFFPKTRARTMATEEKKHVDGCATFWKASKYNLVEKRVVEFNQVALQRPDMRKSDDMFNRVMSRDNIAALATQEFLKTFFGFDCKCRTCTLSTSDRVSQDDRVTRHDELTKSRSATPLGLLSFTRRLASLAITATDDKMFTPTLGFLVENATLFCTMGADEHNAKAWAKLWREWAWFVKDEEKHKEATGFLDPRESDTWGRKVVGQKQKLMPPPDAVNQFFASLELAPTYTALPPPPLSSRQSAIASLEAAASANGSSKKKPSNRPTPSSSLPSASSSQAKEPVDSSVASNGASSSLSSVPAPLPPPSSSPDLETPLIQGWNDPTSDPSDSKAGPSKSQKKRSKLQEKKASSSLSTDQGSSPSPFLGPSPPATKQTPKSPAVVPPSSPAVASTSTTPASSPVVDSNSSWKRLSTKEKKKENDRIKNSHSDLAGVTPKPPPPILESFASSKSKKVVAGQEEKVTSEPEPAPISNKAKKRAAAAAEAEEARRRKEEIEAQDLARKEYEKKRAATAATSSSSAVEQSSSSSTASSSTSPSITTTTPTPTIPEVPSFGPTSTHHQGVDDRAPSSPTTPRSPVAQKKRLKTHTTKNAPEVSSAPPTPSASASAFAEEGEETVLTAAQRKKRKMREKEKARAAAVVVEGGGEVEKEAGGGGGEVGGEEGARDVWWR